MTKFWYLLVICAAIGLFGAIASIAVEFNGVGEEFLLNSNTSGGDTPGKLGVPKLVILGEKEYLFGSMEQHKTFEHVWVVQNDGDAPLEVSMGSPSCGMCVHPKFDRATVPPGKTVEVLVEFHTKKPGPEFREGFELETNDPVNQRIQLSSRGVILISYLAEPKELALGNIPSSEGGDGKVQITSFRDDNLQITEQEFSDPDTAKFFDVDFVKTDADVIAQKKYARSGLIAKIRVKPGLPLGPITQTLRLKTNSEDAILEIPITGTTVSDVSVIGGGGGVRFENNILGMGVRKSADGFVANLHVMVKGPLRDSVQVSVGEVEPADVLKVTLGEKKTQGSGAVHLYPLKIEIAKGSPIVNRSGAADSKAAKVVLESTHPDAKQIMIEVRFVTE